MNLFAGRAVYDISDHWRLGTLVTHGDPNGATDNTLVSVDSTWSTSQFAGGKNLTIATWGARSSGQTVAGSPDGYGIDVAYPNDLWWMDFSYDDYGDGLDPAMGFLQRPGTRQIYANVNWQPRPAADSALSWVRQFDIFGTYRLVLDTSGRVESEDWRLVPLQGTTQSGWSGYVEINPSYELLTAPYEIVPGVVLPPGEYHFANVECRRHDRAVPRLLGDSGGRSRPPLQRPLRGFLSRSQFLRPRRPPECGAAAGAGLVPRSGRQRLGPRPAAEARLLVQPRSDAAGDWFSTTM